MKLMPNRREGMNKRAQHFEEKAQSVLGFEVAFKQIRHAGFFRKYLT